MSHPQPMPEMVAETPDEASDYFGSDATGPYDSALREGVRQIFLYDLASGELVDVIPVWRFSSRADHHERALLERGTGPLLDLGCGPARMVQECMRAGRPALGVDLSPAACELAVAQGIPVLRRSLFDALPGEGRWGTVLLIDGNIGIGGDPQRLLRRVFSLMTPGGTVIVESHADATVDASFTAMLSDARGRSSATFRWASVGAYALRHHARRAGLRLTREWTAGGRTFCEYARPTT
jgi:SAM-dependent methyltransferase